MLSKYISS